MSTPEPIILVMPEGITPESEEMFRQQASNCWASTGVRIVYVPHGTELAAQRVVHEVPPAVLEALHGWQRLVIALDRVADQLEKDHRSRHGHPNTGPR